MLEYPLDEAEELLHRNRNTAQTALGTVDDDLDFLRYEVEYFSTFKFILLKQRSDNDN